MWFHIAVYQITKSKKYNYHLIANVNITFLSFWPNKNQNQLNWSPTENVITQKFCLRVIKGKWVQNNFYLTYQDHLYCYS